MHTQTSCIKAAVHWSLACIFSIILKVNDKNKPSSIFPSHTVVEITCFISSVQSSRCLSTNKYYDSTYISSTNQISSFARIYDVVTIYPHFFVKRPSLFHANLMFICKHPQIHFWRQNHHKVWLLSGFGNTVWLLGDFIFIQTS